MFEKLSHRQKAILAIILHNIPELKIESLSTLSISEEEYYVVIFEVENKIKLLVSLPNKGNTCILNIENSNNEINELLANLQEYIESSNQVITEGHTFQFKETEPNYSKGEFVNASETTILSSLQGHHDLNNNDYVHYYVLVLSNNE